jgi:hypothetical protein
LAEAVVADLVLRRQKKLKSQAEEAEAEGQLTSGYSPPQHLHPKSNAPLAEAEPVGLVDQQKAKAKQAKTEQNHTSGNCYSPMAENLVKVVKPPQAAAEAVSSKGNSLVMQPVQEHQERAQKRLDQREAALAEEAEEEVLLRQKPKKVVREVSHILVLKHEPQKTLKAQKVLLNLSFLAEEAEEEKAVSMLQQPQAVKAENTAEAEGAAEAAPKLVQQLVPEVKVAKVS